MTYFGEILGIGAPELIIVLAIILLLFGGKKLPELFKSAGSSVRELRKGLNGDGEDGKPKVSSTDAQNR
ncbi:MAG TPA: twin-arginine translocase TatA/TatE family subunit [Candidatus Saccharimonas sp.]|nr:twin-arginine translocase TatA/TatE family subunit [Candidatus Saccharimonas sp.]